MTQHQDCQAFLMNNLKNKKWIAEEGSTSSAIPIFWQEFEFTFSRREIEIQHSYLNRNQL